VQAQILNLLKDLQTRWARVSIHHAQHLGGGVPRARSRGDVSGPHRGAGNVDEVLRSPRHPYTQALLSAVPVIDPRASAT
jgi:peptide/nickel transport system ATP-binding protein